MFGRETPAAHGRADRERLSSTEKDGQTYSAQQRLSQVRPSSELIQVCRLAQNIARNCGYAVHPVREDKRPASPNGFYNAEREPAKIADLWRRHPGPLVGIACEASGISVLDIDIKHPEAVSWWRANHKRLP